jgi:hypothetical protein
MARTKPEKKTPARNFILEPKVKSRGRGENKVEVVEGVTKTRLQSRLYCVPVFQGPIRKAKKNAKFECFTDIEAAQKAMGMPELPVPLAPVPTKGKRQGVKELRAEIARLMEARGAAAPAPKPAFSPANLALMEKDMKGLRGTPEEHRARAKMIEGLLEEYPDAGEYGQAWFDRAWENRQWASPHTESLLSDDARALLSYALENATKRKAAR